MAGYGFGWHPGVVNVITQKRISIFPFCRVKLNHTKVKKVVKKRLKKVKTVTATGRDAGSRA
jgi:hypothetical protein